MAVEHWKMGPCRKKACRNRCGCSPKRRNPVVLAMMARSAKAGRHSDRRKQASKKACRGRVLVGSVR